MDTIEPNIQVAATNPANNKSRVLRTIVVTLGFLGLPNMVARTRSNIGTSTIRNITQPGCTSRSDCMS
jgi:hypothetical protein